MPDNVIQLPLNKKNNELIEHISIKVTPTLDERGTVNLILQVTTDTDQYYNNETLPYDIFESHFDQIFNECRDKLKILIHRLHY